MRRALAIGAVAACALACATPARARSIYSYSRHLIVSSTRADCAKQADCIGQSVGGCYWAGKPPRIFRAEGRPIRRTRLDCVTSLRYEGRAYERCYWLTFADIKWYAGRYRIYSRYRRCGNGHVRHLTPFDIL